jgi:hypothetical protein
VPRRFAALRMLLLVLVAFGVAGMHTTGHPSDGHGTRIMVVSHEASAMQAPVMNAPVQVAGAGLVVLPRSGGGGFDPSEVCLAILTAVGLAVLIACALLAVRSVRGGGAPVPAVLAALGRGPPPWRCHGLVLADLSVLRR